MKSIVDCRHPSPEKTTTTKNPVSNGGVFIAYTIEGNTFDRNAMTKTHDTQKHLLLLSKLVFVLRANDP